MAVQCFPPVRPSCLVPVPGYCLTVDARTHSHYILQVNLRICDTVSRVTVSEQISDGRVAVVSHFRSVEMGDAEWHHVAVVARRPGQPVNASPLPETVESALPAGVYSIDELGEVNFVPLKSDVQNCQDPAVTVAAIMESADRQEQLWQECQQDGDSLRDEPVRAASRCLSC